MFLIVMEADGFSSKVTTQEHFRSIACAKNHLREINIGAADRLCDLAGGFTRAHGAFDLAKRPILYIRPPGKINSQKFVVKRRWRAKAALFVTDTFAQS
jgi:hypothetical protein